MRSRDHEAVVGLLRGIRESAGLSQRELGVRIGVAQSWVGKLETGERNVSLVEFVKIVRACGGDPQRAFADVLTKLGA